MKLIILEGQDGLGKNTLIKGICEHFHYDNVTIRHFSKPPKELTTQEAIDFQFKCFTNEAKLVHEIKEKFSYTRYRYFDNVIIWNRSHLGEFVHGQLFRNEDPKEIKDKLLFFENLYFSSYEQKMIQICLITMIAEPEFTLSKEDGQSFSKNLEEKKKELELFQEAHEFSTIKNKYFLKVDKVSELPTGTEWIKKDVEFRDKQEILNEVLTIINEK